MDLMDWLVHNLAFPVFFALTFLWAAAWWGGIVFFGMLGDRKHLHWACGVLQIVWAIWWFCFLGEIGLWAVTLADWMKGF